MSKQARRSSAGITLVELMMAMLLVVILLPAIGFAFAVGLGMERDQKRRQSEQDHTEQMRARITQMLAGARLSVSSTDMTTYFIGEPSGTGTSSLGCDTLTFTTTAPDIPLAAVDDSDEWETQMDNRGPIGGFAEVAYSTVPIGDSGNHTGLFERVQRPSDLDPTQGGMQSVLAPEVKEIGFQFWDGTEWITTWDTTQGTRRLPSAVMVSYTTQQQPSSSSPKAFIVRIPASDVTTLNPVTNMEGTP
jgi:type II secretory pathway pseudopilin PulG